MAVANVEDPSTLSHLIAGALRIKTEEKQELLEEVDVAKRLRRLSEILARELEVVAIGSRIQSQVQSELDRSQREYVLRQQLKAIQEELGERDPAEAEVEDLREQLEQIALPEEVAPAGRPRALAGSSACRRRRPSTASSATTSSGSPRCRGTRAPRTTSTSRTRARCSTPTTTTSRRSRTASSSSSPSASSPAAAARRRARSCCFVGPPGVGKTSLGPLDRQRARAALRAHQRRRHARRGRDPRPPAHLHRRDARHDHPRAARRGLQQPAVHDRRDRQDGLGLPRRPGRRRCSRCSTPSRTRRSATTTSTCRSTSRSVMFVTTANTLDTIPGPLRDRMEVIQLAGYTEEEKLQIAKRYLVPRQIERNGLKKSQISFSDAGLRTIIADYTREAGVRNLEREIGSVCRKVARQVAEGSFAQAGRASPGPRVARAARAPALPVRPAAAHGGARAWPPAWPGRRSAATCCSSRRRRCRARASSRSPASSAT